MASLPSARARATSSPGGTGTRLCSCSTALAMAATSLATTARPLAIASSTTFGNPSRSPLLSTIDGTTTRCAGELVAHLRMAQCATQRHALREPQVPDCRAQRRALGPVADDAKPKWQIEQSDGAHEYVEAFLLDQSAHGEQPQRQWRRGAVAV